MRAATWSILTCHLLLACGGGRADVDAGLPDDGGQADVDARLPDGGQADVDAGFPGNVDAAPALDGRPSDANGTPITDAAPIDMDAAVEPECPYGHIRQGGSCVEARHLSFYVTETSTNACFYEAGGIDNSALLVAEMTYGPCKVTVLRHGNSNLNLFAGNAGTLSITGSDTLTLEPPGVTPGCFGSALPTAPVLAGAAEIHFLASGGPDVAAFDETLPVPEPIAAVIGPVMVAQPADITWTGAGGDIIYISAITTDLPLGQSAFLFCSVPDDGAFTIPGEATAELFSGDVYVAVQRVSRRHVERDGLAIEFDVHRLYDERQDAPPDAP